jgi:hypothetical protein
MKVQGVSYDVNWKAFKQGASIFIPCLDTKRARAQVLVVTKRLRIKILIKIVVVDGIKGLRIWSI